MAIGVLEGAVGEGIVQQVKEKSLYGLINQIPMDDTEATFGHHTTRRVGISWYNPTQDPTLASYLHINTEAYKMYRNTSRSTPTIEARYVQQPFTQYTQALCGDLRYHTLHAHNAPIGGLLLCLQLLQQLRDRLCHRLGWDVRGACNQLRH